MKKVTDDLMITGIDISIARLGALVRFKYLDEYEATAWYLRRSSGNKWLESGPEVPALTHESITLEVEDNEEEILTWVEEQFAKETDHVDPARESYNILQLQKMDAFELAELASSLEMTTCYQKKQELIYAILEKQAKS